MAKAPIESPQPRALLSPRRASSAFTLVELLLAMVVLSLIALAVAAMLSAVSYGTSSTHDMRRLVIRGNILTVRLDIAIRNARQLLAASNHTLVLWTADTDGNGKPSPNEMQVIDLQQNQVDSWTAAATAAAPVYPLDTDFLAAAMSLEHDGTLHAQTWTIGAGDWGLSVNHATPADVSLVTWRVTLSDGLMSQRLVQSVSLRNRETS